MHVNSDGRVRMHILGVCNSASDCLVRVSLYRRLKVQCFPSFHNLRHTEWLRVEGTTPLPVFLLPNPIPIPGEESRKGCAVPLPTAFTNHERVIIHVMSVLNIETR